MAETELSVVCKNCGAEVSPYVTECPYCGTRIRKRAPKLERHGDEFMPRERRRRRGRRVSMPRIGAAERPYVTYAAILGPAVLLLVQRAADLLPTEVGAIVGSVGSEWWRYLAAPFVYDDLGYLFVVAVALAVFVPSLERRLGMVPVLVLLVACGSLGMLAAEGLEAIDPGDVLVAAGGNGIALGALAAWAVIRHLESRSHPGDDWDVIGAAVIAAVLLALPLVEDSASVVAGLAGGLVGAAAGLAASRAAPARA
jgi:membrane associated rhomboid family serine protease/DNA-directed RNA polymerase subunit RPC12/RpoP